MPASRVPPGEVAWLPWSADAFSRARAERKPVLLCISTAWSHSCREMDRTSYADPAIAALINGEFVPVRVDADRRPDICERYSLGGWPTTAFLTPDGAILGGGTYVPPRRLSAALDEVRAAFAHTRQAASPGIEAALESAAAPTPEIERISAAVFDAYDEVHGGFGAEPKFPHAAPVHLALELHRRAPDARLASIATRTLDAMGWGELYDEVDGGFFRFAASRDWRRPHREKLLAVNAALLGLYADAAGLLDAARFGARAADIVRYVHGWLADVQHGGWYACQYADDAYYAAPEADARRAVPPPEVDTVLYADANAAMASAMLRAASLFDDASLREFALTSLERVLLACYRPGAGVAHYHDGCAQVRGLLADQIAMADAQLDAFDATGNVVYEMMAEELAHYALREMWDEARGGFFDRAETADVEAVGLMRVRLKPFVQNCAAARMLRRLAERSGDHDFARLARETLASAAPEAIAHGPLAAHYVLATL